MNIQEMLGQSSEALETQLEAATQILEKAAADEGIDLNALSTDDFAGLLLEVMGKEAADEGAEGGEGGEAGAGEGGESTETATEGGEPSVVEVFAEATKRAAAEGIELAKLSQADLALVIEGVAADMRDPSYHEKIAQAQAEAEDWERARASMEELGKVAADAFVGRVNETLKLAGDDDDDKEPKGDKAPPFGKAKKDGDDDDDDGKDKKASAKEKVLKHLKNLKGHAGDVADKAKKLPGKADKALQGHGTKNLNRIGAGGEKASPTLKRMAGAAPGVAAGAAVGGGVAAARGRDKKASYIDEEGLKVARQFLLDNGIDPDTGDEAKLASDEEVSERAVEILRAAGYEV
jgi:hypothetical protein